MINISKLDNGATIIHEPMADVETVSMELMVKTGSLNETQEENGLSHFLEHMAFKGTTSRTAKQIAYDFESIGASFNAYTSKEVTSYYSKVLKEYVGKSLEILTDMFENSIFDSTELERERGVILQEIAMTHDAPDDMIFDYYYSTAFKDQPYGRSIAGSEENVKNFKTADLVSYRDRHYGAENVIFSVAGNVEFEQIRDLTNKYFTKKQSGKSPNPEKISYSGGCFKKEKDLEQVQCILGFEGISCDDKRRFVMSVMNRLLGGGMSSRLFQEVREIRGLCYSIHSYSDATFGSGSFQIYTAVESKNINAALDAIAIELKKATTSLNEEEMDRAKVKLKSSILMSLENTNSRASANAANMVFHGKIDTPEEIIDAINAVTIEDAQELLKSIIASKPSLALYGNLSGSYDYEALVEKF